MYVCNCITNKNNSLVRSNVQCRTVYSNAIPYVVYPTLQHIDREYHGMPSIIVSYILFNEILKNGQNILKIKKSITKYFFVPNCIL